MNSVSNIIQKIFALEFYRSNASLFIIVLGLGVGFMKSEDHVALGEALISSYLLLLIPFSVWVIYTFLILDFNQRTSRRNENEFIYHFVFLNGLRKWSISFQLAVAEFIPAIAYGLFLIVLCVRHQFIGSLVLLVVVLLILLGAISFGFYRALHLPGHNAKISFVSRWISRYIKRPYFTVAFEWLLRKQPFPLLGSKITGLLLLWATMSLYHTDQYDARLMMLGIVIGASLQAGVIAEWHSFENIQFIIFRGLPYSLLHRSTTLLISLATYMIPEIGLLINLFPSNLNLIDLLTGSALLISIPFLAYGFLFTKLARNDRYATVHFFASMVWVVATLSNVPAMLIAVINVILGGYCWTFYYSYEPQQKFEDKSTEQVRHSG